MLWSGAHYYHIEILARYEYILLTLFLSVTYYWVYLYFLIYTHDFNLGISSLLSTRL